MIININKPKGMTSHDVVDEVRNITGEKRVGHAGTLDPFATGVLVVAVGREDTKKLGEITKNTEKEYQALLVLGKTSTTGDPEGVITKQRGVRPPFDRVQSVVEKFKGEIMQTPPAFSAVKIKGVRAYKLARAGKTVELPPRKITIHSIDILEFEYPLLQLEITCSAGTYIRSLAQDIGKELGCGAYVKELMRTRVGNFTIEESIQIESLTSNILR
ncbi:tRNA pseudouridine(55) synthase TruB [Patescibacteria group bacterium]|nr:tRNA pseudouridine(55) synthase TruB [Patescibacteria group bacterium]